MTYLFTKRFSKGCGAFSVLCMTIGERVSDLTYMYCIMPSMLIAGENLALASSAESFIV